MFDTLGVVALLTLAVVAIWLAKRAWRARNRAVKWVGVVLSTVLTAVFILVNGAVLIGFYKINFPPHVAPLVNVTVAATPAQVARGAKFAAICAGCHSPDGKVPLVGRNFFGAGDPPFGTMYAANLTPAGEIKDWSDAEIIRAIREGVHKSGRALMVMPSEIFHNLSDVDVQAVVAYLRSQPAAGQNTPPTRLNILAAALIGAGVARTSVQQPITHGVTAPAEGPSAEYGKYLVSVLACQVCHGENLAGRKVRGPGPPAGPNLTVIVPTWSAEGFIRTFRTGVDPANHTLAQAMPWQLISTFATEEDLTAIYTYLHGLKPIDRLPD